MRIDDKIKISIIFFLVIITGLYSAHTIQPKTDPIAQNETAMTIMYLNHNLPNTNNIGTNLFYVPLIRIGSGIR